MLSPSILDSTFLYRCKNHQWACEDGLCIELRQQCDGVSNCAGGEDERFCGEDEGEVESLRGESSA